MRVRCFTISEFINVVSLFFYNFIEFIILLYTLSVNYFPWYKKNIIWKIISFSNFLDVLPEFTCASAIGNLWSISLWGNILRHIWSETLGLETLATQVSIPGLPVPSAGFSWNILLLEAWRTTFLPSWSASMLSIVSVFSFFFSTYIRLFLFLKFKSSYNKLLCALSASSKVVLATRIF